MQIDLNYGIIIDNQETILQEYTSALLPVFPNANNIDDPIYMQNYQSSVADFKNQQALQILWNCVNRNTAQGLGLDILNDTILNLPRRGLIPSFLGVELTVAGLTSKCIVEIELTLTGSPTPPINIAIGTWTVTSGSVTPSPAYTNSKALSFSVSGTYFVEFESTDTTTAVPTAAFNTLSSISGITVVSVTNPADSVLGSVKITNAIKFSANAITSSPSYAVPLEQTYTFTENGTYNFIVYSNDIYTKIAIGQINTISNNLGGLLTAVTNNQANILGTPIETDAQYQQRSRYYLNVQGSTYYGLEKAILDLKIPSLRSVFAPEVITNSLNAKTLVIQMTITGATVTPVTIPVGWSVTTTTTTSDPYKTLQAYIFTTDGTHYVNVYSNDVTTNIPIGDVTGGDVVTGVSGVANITPAINGTSGLGQRGYYVFLDYPTKEDGTFDLNDVYLQLIAQSVFNYKTFGIQTYGGFTGATIFPIDLPYATYKNSVYLLPMQYKRTSCVLQVYYTTDPNAAGYLGQVFPADKIANMKEDILQIINTYFLSKSLPTDLVYSINELTTIIQNTYTGIISLSSFTFGLPEVPSTGLVFLTRPIGFVFQLSLSDFTFTKSNVA